MLLVANWKMNVASIEEAKKLVEGIASSDALSNPSSNPLEMVVCPSFVWLASLKKQFPNIQFGAQDCSHRPKGAYTGDVSAEMVRGAGAGWVIVGHSERRENYFEEGEIIENKLTLAKIAGLESILCIGEDGGQDAKQTIEKQLAHLPVTPSAIAYEPIWAIGSGKTPTNKDIAGRIGLIKSICDTKVLYGGSVDAATVEQLVNVNNCDGFLVGGASLDADKFNKIMATIIAKRAKMS